MQTLRTLASTAVVACVMLAVVVGLAVVEQAVSPTRPVASAQRVTEDDARWECTTMGNRRCGPRHGHPPLPAGHYARVPRSLVGTVGDTVHGRRVRITRACVWQRGDTSYVVCPHGVVSS